MLKPVTYKRRLYKLVKHLEKGKLAHKKFDFSEFHSGGNKSDLKGYCGTLGCALGECPVVFPKEWNGAWKLSFHDSIFNDDESVVSRGKRFFDLNYDELKHLFIPDFQNTKLYGGKVLGDKASRYAVAKNIRAFIKIKYHTPKK